MDSISGFQLGKSNSEVYAKIYFQTLNISVNSQADIHISMIHTQTNGTGIINVGVYYASFELTVVQYKKMKKPLFLEF